MLAPSLRRSVIQAYTKVSGYSSTSTKKTCCRAFSSQPAPALGRTDNNDAQRGNRPVETALVVGGGVAGLGAAACLGRVGVRVTLAATDGRHRPEDGPDPGIGIWSHGLDCLERLGILAQLEAHGRYMGEAGYKDVAGRWLARPSPLRGFREPGGRGVSILFVRESKLIEALRSALADGTEVISADLEELRWESTAGAAPDDPGIAQGSSDSQALGSSSEAGSDSGSRRRRRHRPGLVASLGIVAGAERQQPLLVRPDLLVGADGQGSLVRRFLLGGDVAAAADPERRGYTVYRGVCRGEAVAGGRGVRGTGDGGEEAALPWGLDSFQTWGPGLRFASVPLAGDERMWFATAADRFAKNPGVGPGSHRDPGAAHDPSTKSFLLGTFEGWHEPIRSLLRATPEESIIREDARAMTARGLRLAASAASGALSPESSGAAPDEVGAGAALVGDAAHTLDPVLAQGAGVALEDAFWLAHHVKDCNAGESNGRASPPAGQVSSLADALVRYERSRLKRALLLSHLSDLSQTLGELGPSYLTRLRNSVFLVAPEWLKSRSFDGFTAAALAGNSRGALASAFDTVGRRKDRRGYGIPEL